MPKNKTSRCTICNKRLGLLPFICKCGIETCSAHRWPGHPCDFDYYLEEKQKLERENPVVSPKKINTIQ